MNRTEGMNATLEIRDAPGIILRLGIETEPLRIWGRIAVGRVRVPLIEGDSITDFGWTGHHLGPIHSD